MDARTTVVVANAPPPYRGRQRKTMESHRRTSPNAAAHTQHPRPAPRRSPPRIEKLLDDVRSPPIRRRVRKICIDLYF
ncbi:hypothetical protein ACS0TY_015436 [Phlomoides rotata]